MRTTERWQYVLVLHGGVRSVRTRLGGRAGRRVPVSRRKRGLRIAPLRRRLLAATIDALVAILALLLGLAGALGVGLITGRKPPGLGGLPLRKLSESTRGRLALRALAFAFAVATSRRQGPGSRVAGIRLVDARTAAQVTVRQAVLRETVRWGWQVATKAATRHIMPQSRSRIEDLKGEISALAREHTDDPEGHQRAIMAFYEEHRIRPRDAWLPAVATTVLATLIDAPMLWSGRNQGLADMIAGTVVVIDR